MRDEPGSLGDPFDETDLGVGLFGMAFGALFTTIIYQFYRGDPPIGIADFSQVIIAITAVVAIFEAKRWRREAIERRKAELAIRILSAAVAYAEMIKRKGSGTWMVEDTDAPIQNEYQLCKRFVAAFFADQLHTYERLDLERSDFSNEMRGYHESATLDEIEASLFESIGGLALFGTRVTMPLTRGRKFKKFWETEE